MSALRHVQRQLMIQHHTYPASRTEEPNKEPTTAVLRLSPNGSSASRGPPPRREPPVDRMTAETARRAGPYVICRLANGPSRYWALRAVHSGWFMRRRTVVRTGLAVQCLAEVGDQLVAVFEADRQAQQGVADADRGARSGAVGHPGGMLDQRFHAAQRHREGEHPGAFAHPAGCVGVASTPPLA